MKNKEIRYLNATELRVAEIDEEVKTDGTEDAPEAEEQAPTGQKLVGYAAVFDSKSEDLGGFREVIKAGAFATPLSNGDDVRALVDHDSSLILGRTKAGTLTLTEDSTGLLAEITLPDTQVARDLSTSIARGDVDQMSFGFVVSDDEWAIEDGQDIRTITGIGSLFDVSVVTYPAYASTEVALRSLSNSNLNNQDEIDLAKNKEKEVLKLRLDLAQREG